MITCYTTESLFSSDPNVFLRMLQNLAVLEVKVPKTVFSELVIVSCKHRKNARIRDINGMA